MTRQDLIDYTAIALELMLLDQGTLDTIIASFTGLNDDERAMVCFLLGAVIGGIQYNNLRIDREVFKPRIDSAISALAADGVSFRYD